MARVWFVRREGEQWVVPGGRPAFEAPLERLVFPLDLGPQRFLRGERLVPRPEEVAPPPEQLQKVMVEATADDLRRLTFTNLQPGLYDSPYSPREVARRIGG